MNTHEFPTTTEPSTDAQWRRRFTVDGVICLVLAALTIAGAVYIWRRWPHDGATGVQLFMLGAICVSAVRDFWEGQEEPSAAPAVVYLEDEVGPLMTRRGPIDEPDPAEIRLAISDPGSFVDRRRFDAQRGVESLTQWQARAVFAVFTGYKARD